MMSVYEPEPIDLEKPIPRLLPLRNLLEEWEANAERLHLARESGRPIGPTTGFKKVNLELGGAFATGLHIVHGNTGAGKTAFALQTACECQCAAIYISCEMGSLELLRRITARVTNQYLGRFKTGEMTPVQSLAYAKLACQSAPNLALIEAIDCPAVPHFIEEAARLWKKETGQDHLLIVVDSLHSWVEGMTDENEYEALNTGLAQLRGIAKRLDCPILGISERNRASATSGGVNAGAGSRKIEYGSESVLDLQRSEKAEEDAEGWVDVDLKFGKNRNGGAGKTIKLRFNGRLMKFEERPF